MKSLQGILEIIRNNARQLRDEFKVERLALFGSYARCEQKDTSDIDILVEYSEPVSLFHVVDTELYLEDLLHMKVDLVTAGALRAEIRDTVLKEAVIV